MPDHLDSVKETLRLYHQWLADAEAKKEILRITTYNKRIAGLQGLIDECEELRRITKPIPASYGDLSDLPTELVKELAGIKVDDLEQQIFTIIKSGGAEVDLDAVLIELFRRFKVLQTRKFLQNKLWRMAQKELIYSIAGRKGVYSATAPVVATEKIIPAPNGFSDDLDDDVPF